MPRNTTGGKNFKKFKTGSEGFRAKASREAADDMINLVRTFERTAPEKISEEDKEAMKYMFAGRIVRRFGHGRMEVYCHDDVLRQCRIRGLLRKKGQCFMDVDSLVVISLREPAESDNEMDIDSAPTKGGDIIGVFDDKQTAMLAKTSINPRLFVTKDANGKEEEDVFDRSDLLDEEEQEGEEKKEEGPKVTKPKGRSQKGAERSFTSEVASGGGGACNEIIDINDL